MVDNNIIEKVVDDAISKSKLLIVKCHENSATLRGKGANVTLATPDGERVPLRHLQDKGYDSNGNHLGYISRIDYPDGTSINFLEGTLTINGVTNRMGFDDNYKTVNGNIQHDPKGSANELFKQQRKDILNQPNGKKNWQHVLNYSPLMKRGKINKELNDLLRKGEDIHSLQEQYKNTALGKLIDGFDEMDNIARNTRCDYENIVVGQQVASININDRRRINDNTGANMTSTSVGFLNDKTLMSHNKITGETRSLDGNNYNWDNTYKVYTVINQGSGATGVYLGYAQNEKIKAWDNSGNSHNELTLPSNQDMTKLLVDEENKIIIQTPRIE